MHKPILKVALDIPLNRLFDYLSAEQSARIGHRVLVPFGRKNLIGIVMALADESDIPFEKLKPIIHVFNDEEPIDSHLLNLIKFSADYYQYPFGQALLAALPVRLRQIAPAKSRTQPIYQLTQFGSTQNIDRFNQRQQVLRRVFSALQAQDFLTRSELNDISSSAQKAIKQLIQDGFVISKKSLASTHKTLQEIQATPTLNSEQLLSVKSIVSEDHHFKAWLLHGITGSGKTEVYMQVMHYILHRAQDINANAQVLVLVPEINLTPQLQARFKNRFPNAPLVSLHSNLSESERLHNWQLSQLGLAKIIIGTRLSIFTPMPHLKLIIIDEEHDSSYKQQDSMRYHARDIALVRAKRLNIPIVLGSATPSLESWHNVKYGKYQLLSLFERAVTAAKLPRIECIDTTKVHLKQGLTPQLLEAISHRLARKEQSLLFINRRGYSPVLLCSACHWIAPCTRCSSRLVVHLSQRKLRCHHCGHEQKIPTQCPSCGNADLHPTGQGTQRLEQTLSQFLPNARIARVDRDSISRKNALVEILAQVHAQEIDILIGTQMLAKGHDFPNLTLVGVIDTDSALHSPDFRASERLFAQLMQVAGRAGRAKKAGQVLIQTEFPFHALFNALRSQDYVTFANNQLLEREQVQFPPYVFTALLRAEANSFATVQQLLTHAFKIARNLQSEVIIYDPVRPHMERINGMERGHILMQGRQRSALQAVLKYVVNELRSLPIATKVRWSIDVDPLEF